MTRASRPKRLRFGRQPPAATRRDRGRVSLRQVLETGIAHLKAGRLEPAEAAFELVLAQNPNNADALNLLGAVAIESKSSDRALELLEKAVALRPDSATFHMHLGIVLGTKGRLTDAAQSLQTAIELSPKLALAYNNLAGIYLREGRVKDAVALQRTAVDLQPDAAATHSNLILSMNYDSAFSAEDIREECRRWAERHAVPEDAAAAHDNEPDPERRLRIGFVSPDFRNHPVSAFLEPLLDGRDRRALEVTCYAQLAIADQVTRRLEALAERWRWTPSLDDEHLARQIRVDGIDILIDLAGHTADNRLPVFARRPAPIQVTWLGYPGSTGMAAMDYRLTDAIADPPEEGDGLGSEALVRLPRGFHCYRPPEGTPEVSPPPSTKSGRVTFGSFNNLAKVTEEVVAVWSRLLRAVPDSRLLIKSLSIADARSYERYARLFADHGIDPGRVAFLPRVANQRDNMALYRGLDLALDSFPYNGTTTTCDAAWMGVPVVTLRGACHAARVGASLLTRIGLTELIAESESDYVGIATALAGDPERLIALRSGLRARVQDSPLHDRAGFARDFEAALREMWRRWCAQRDAAQANSQ